MDTVVALLASLPQQLPDGPQLLGVVAAVALLLFIVAKLNGINALLLPNVHRPALADVPAMLLRKALLVVHGFFFLLLSSDKVSSKDLRRHHAARANAFQGGVDREVRVIFIRHGESVWNYVFNRGFGPSFLLRLISTTLHELCALPIHHAALAPGARALARPTRTRTPPVSVPQTHAPRPRYLTPWEDSAYLDSPLSSLGLEQCAALQQFLRNPCLDKRVESDFAALTTGESYSLVVSSQLRRAACTAAIALSDRLQRSNEAVVLHSSCQEISRNFDTMALAPKGRAPQLDRALELRAPAVNFDGSANQGNKSLRFRGLDRVQDFARWVSDRPETTIIVAGHSLWFRSFFQAPPPPHALPPPSRGPALPAAGAALPTPRPATPQAFLPSELDHVCKKRKMVNCGVVGFTLQIGRDADECEHHRIDPESLAVVYGGFASK